MDNGFKTAAYPSCTATFLREAVKRGYGNTVGMGKELARRIAVDAGDASQATDGDKLHSRVGKRALIENGGQF